MRMEMLVALLILVPLVLPLAACALLYGIFWYENGTAAAEARAFEAAPDIAPPSLPLLVWGTLQAWLSVVCIYLGYPFRRCFFLPAGPSGNTTGDAEKAGDTTSIASSGAFTGYDRKPPLLLVHPASHNAASWLVHRHFLRKAGYDRLYYFEYSCRGTSFAAVQGALAERLLRLCEAFPEERPLAMGASLGALLLRASLANSPAGEVLRTRLGGCVTLACPHRGSRLSPLAPRALGEVLRSIGFDGKTVADIEEGEKNSLPALPCVAISSPLDEMVVPSRALTPPAGWAHRITAPISHISIMLHIPTVRMAIGELDRLCGRG